MPQQLDEVLRRLRLGVAFARNNFQGIARPQSCDRSTCYVLDRAHNILQSSIALTTPVGGLRATLGLQSSFKVSFADMLWSQRPFGAARRATTGFVRLLRETNLVSVLYNDVLTEIIDSPFCVSYLLFLLKSEARYYITATLSVLCLLRLQYLSL